ncbi:MAG: polymerase sigma factor, sigma-70 family [Mycobacterium sp.]|jgi:RNA polymerase sigma-70 factor (ECF subfamily)|nr:polymerase sigma factor, sigma-70 family [Mycobacterium sp.]
MTSNYLAASATVHEALTSLSAEHRGAIIRVHFLKESLSEFARRERISGATAKSRLHDALHALRHAVRDRGVLP